MRLRDLGPDFLRRVRVASLLVGTLGLLVALLYLGVLPAAAAAYGLGLALVNLWLLEYVFRRLLRPEPAFGPRVMIALLVKLPLLVGGAALALFTLHLSPAFLAAGFSLPLLVIVLKVLGRMLVRSGAVGGEGTGRMRGKPVKTLLMLLCVAGPLVVLASHALRHTGDAAGLLAPLPAFAEEGHGAAHGEPAAHEGEAAGGAHAPEFPNLIVILNQLFPGASWAHFLHRWETPLFSLPVILLLAIVAMAASRRPKMVPGPLQNVVEMAVEGFTNFVEGILGHDARRYVPFLGTLFFYIWFSNLEGLIPLMKSPTSVFNTTVALAICVFVYVQFTGLTRLGPIKWLLHLAGDPKDALGWAMVPLMLPLHVIGEFAKPMSLSLRLFGNVFGEDVLLAVFAGLVLIPLSFLGIKVGLPLHLPFIFLALLLSSIQALVFTLLSTLYFSQMLPHEEHGGHH